jgi:hypothetical protein
MAPSPAADIPVIVAGMHRSGTSMTASFMNTLGVDFGDRLLPGDRNNAPGYFEDVDFLAFHGRLLEAATHHDEPGWPDWGWTESERLDTTSFEAHAAEARALIASRADLPLWGFKDPRTTLFLPFWHAFMPHARDVLVYRYPWDVADSIDRVGVAIFAERPDLALRAWAFYNRHLLDFYRQHRDIAVLVSADALAADLDRFAALVVGKLALPLSVGDAEQRLRARYRPDLMRAMPHDAPLVSLLASLDPEAIALLRALDAAADMPSGYTGERAIAPLRAAMALYHALKVEQRRSADLSARLSRYPAPLRVIERLTREKITARLTRMLGRVRPGRAPETP